MKSVLILGLTSLVESKDCTPPESDDVYIYCDGSICFIECLSMDLVPPGTDTIQCDNDTGLPKSPFPTRCLSPSKCPDIPTANNRIVECTPDRTVSHPHITHHYYYFESWLFTLFNHKLLILIFNYYYQSLPILIIIIKSYH